MLTSFIHDLSVTIPLDQSFHAIIQSPLSLFFSLLGGCDVNHIKLSPPGALGVFICQDGHQGTVGHCIRVWPWHATSCNYLPHILALAVVWLHRNKVGSETPKVPASFGHAPLLVWRMKGWWKRKGVVVTHLAFQPASLPRPSGPRLLILVLPTSGRTGRLIRDVLRENGALIKWLSEKQVNIINLETLGLNSTVMCMVADYHCSRTTTVRAPGIDFLKAQVRAKKGLTYLPDMCLIWLVLIWLYMLLHGLDPDPLLGVEATGPLGATAGCGRHPSWCMGDQETLHTFFEAIGVGQP